MISNNLSVAAAPWIWKISDSSQLLLENVNKVIQLDAQRMQTINGVFEEFARGFEFPSYFGMNSAAFDECLSDLSWMNFESMCIVIEKSDWLLIGENASEVDWLLRTLDSICAEWSHEVKDGQVWDRSAIPFHVVLIFATGSREFFSNIPLLDDNAG